MKLVVGLAFVFSRFSTRSRFMAVSSDLVFMSDFSPLGISSSGLKPSVVKAFLRKLATGSEIFVLELSSFSLRVAS